MEFDNKMPTSATYISHTTTTPRPNHLPISTQPTPTIPLPLLQPTPTLPVPPLPPPTHPLTVQPTHQPFVSFAETKNDAAQTA